MQTKYAAQRRQRQRIKQFVRTEVEPIKCINRARTLPVNQPQPATFNKPPVKGPTEKSPVPFLMEPLFKAKDFDPL